MKRQTTQGVFALSFTIALVLLGVFGTMAVLVLQPKAQAPRVTPSQPAVQEAKGAGGYLPGEEEAITVLFMASQKQGELPGSFLLVGFEPAKGKIPVLPLPETLLVTFEGQEATLGQVLAEKGPQGAKAAVEETLGVAVERYVRLTRGGVIDLSSLLGQVEYTLPASVALKGYGSEIVIDSGLQRLDGKRAADLMSYRLYPGGEQQRLQIMGEICSAIINQRLDVVQSSLLDTVFRQVLSLVDTDITYRDYEFRVQAARFLEKLQVQAATPIPLLLQVEQTGTRIQKETLLLVKKLYHPPQKK